MLPLLYYITSHRKGIVHDCFWAVSTFVVLVGVYHFEGWVLCAFLWLKAYFMLGDLSCGPTTEIIFVVCGCSSSFRLLKHFGFRSLIFV